MGAGITMAQGFNVIEPDKKAIAFVGDSTFFASGMTGVANAVYNKHDITIVVLDNATTAMTGFAASSRHGRNAHRAEFSAPVFEYQEVLSALGVKKITKANPLFADKAIEAAREAIDYDGPSAVIYESPCTKLTKAKPPVYFIANACAGCRKCVTTIGCPALGWSEVGPFDRDEPCDVRWVRSLHGHLRIQGLSPAPHENEYGLPVAAALAAFACGRRIAQSIPYATRVG